MLLPGYFFVFCYLHLVNIYSKMKHLLTLSFLVFGFLKGEAQEAELDKFVKTLNLFLDFTRGKVDSLPLTKKGNYEKMVKAVDQSFEEFVKHNNSGQYEKFRQAQGHSNLRFINAENRVSIYLTSFNIKEKTFEVFGYTCADRRIYMIKDRQSNTVVFAGNNGSYEIDNLDNIDDQHVLIIENNGDRGTSRSAFVLSTVKTPWVKIKAFEGKAFGQVPADYLNKQFVKAREELQLEYERVFGMKVPDDINKIYYDPPTKTISYKEYSDLNNFKTVKAAWINNKFIIDDYYANENFSENVAVPE